jgi:hypothetical protein
VVKAWIDGGTSDPEGSITAERSEHDGMIEIVTSHRRLLITREGIQGLIARLSDMDSQLASRYESVR